MNVHNYQLIEQYHKNCGVTDSDPWREKAFQMKYQPCSDCVVPCVVKGETDTGEMDMGKKEKQ